MSNEKKEILHVGQIYKQDMNNGRTRLCSDIIVNGQNETLYFDVENCWSKYLVTDFSDCFILGVLERAMKNSWNIEFKTPMSEELYYNLTTYTIPIYARNIKKFHEIELIGDTSIGQVLSEGKVGTGFSAGVDSFYSVLKHIGNKKCPAHNVTHLLLATNGAASTGISEALDQEWMEVMLKKLRPYSDKLGMELIDVYGNIDMFYAKDRCLDGDALTTAAFVYALQKLFSTYYWASAYPGEIFKFDEYDGGFFESLAVPYVSTRQLRFYHSGSETNRLGKVKYISKNPIVQKGLTVCGEPDGKNCGYCVKCLRTMSELNAVANLDDFKESFPVEEYVKHFNSKLAQEIAIDHPPFTTDILNAMRENNKKIPWQVYPMAYLYYKPSLMLRKKFRNSIWLRKLLYKYNLDRILLGRQQSPEERERKLKGEFKKN